MKKHKSLFPIYGLLVSAVFLLFSCNMNPEMVEKQAPAPATTTNADRSAALYPGGPVFSSPVALKRVDIFTHVSNSLTGTVTVQITNSAGTVVGSTTVWGSSLVKGEGKNTFYFPSTIVNSGEKYRINVRRSNVHNYVNDYFYWRSSNGSTDVYTRGTSYFASPGFPFDMAFITYSDGYVDQTQTVKNYGFGVSNTVAVWQEFVPQKIWVIGLN